MKIKILAICTVLVIFCSLMHFVEPTAATSNQKGYLIDHGTKYYVDHYTDENKHYIQKFKVTWKTYWYSKNLRKVFKKYYAKKNGKKWVFSWKETNIINKVSKNKIKLTCILYGSGTNNCTIYLKTKMSTRNFYWKIYRPAIFSYI